MCIVHRSYAVQWDALASFHAFELSSACPAATVGRGGAAPGPRRHNVPPTPCVHFAHRYRSITAPSKGREVGSTPVHPCTVDCSVASVHAFELSSACPAVTVGRRGAALSAAAMRPLSLRPFCTPLSLDYSPEQRARGGEYTGPSLRCSVGRSELNPFRTESIRN